MTFQQLTYVVEISKCGSINKAAGRLKLSQSGISAAVRELEEELGIQFFRRSNRGVEFTPEGEEFLGYAVSLLEQKRRVEGLYGPGRDQGSPARFSVSTQRYPFTGEAFLQLLRAAEDRRFRFSLKETGMDAVIDDVYDHRSDLGVIYLTEMTEKIVGRLLDARALTFHPIAAVTPCAYVRRGHPLARRAAVSEQDLEGCPYVSFERPQGVAADFSEEYPSVRRPDRWIQVNNRAAMMRVLAGTDAYTTGSGLLVEDEPVSRDIVTVPLLDKSPVRVGWLAPRSSRLSPQAEQFVRLLERTVAASMEFTEALHRSLREAENQKEEA